MVKIGQVFLRVLWVSIAIPYSTNIFYIPSTAYFEDIVKCNTKILIKMEFPINHQINLIACLN